MSPESRLQTSSAKVPKATGPRSHEGKARSSRNATKHGLRAENPVLDGIECFTEWETHRDAYVGAWAPRDPLEEELAERAALLKWKLGRAERFERLMTAARMRAAVQKLLADPTLPPPSEQGVIDQSIRIDELIEDCPDHPTVQRLLEVLVLHSIPDTTDSNALLRFRGSYLRELSQVIGELERRRASHKKDGEAMYKRMFEMAMDQLPGPCGLHSKDCKPAHGPEVEELEFDEPEESAPTVVQPQAVVATQPLRGGGSSFGNNGVKPIPTKTSVSDQKPVAPVQKPVAPVSIACSQQTNGRLTEAKAIAAPIVPNATPHPTALAAHAPVPSPMVEAYAEQTQGSLTPRQLKRERRRRLKLESRERNVF